MRWLRKALAIGGGGLLVLLGLAMLPTPFPGILLVMAGAGLIASESARAARLLSRLRETLRRLTRPPTG